MVTGRQGLKLFERARYNQRLSSRRVVKGRIHQLADQLENSLRLLNILT